MVVLLGLAAATLYGAGDFLGGLATRRAPVLVVLMLAETASVAVAVPAPMSLSTCRALFRIALRDGLTARGFHAARLACVDNRAGADQRPTGELGALLDRDLDLVLPAVL